MRRLFASLSFHMACFCLVSAALAEQCPAPDNALSCGVPGVTQADCVAADCCFDAAAFGAAACVHPACSDTTCHNGGKCVKGLCVCSSGFSGVHCDDQVKVVHGAS